MEFSIDGRISVGLFGRRETSGKRNSPKREFW
jgi:hypothetical protein